MTWHLIFTTVIISLFACSCYYQIIPKQQHPKSVIMRNLFRIYLICNRIIESQDEGSNRRTVLKLFPTLKSCVWLTDRDPTDPPPANRTPFSECVTQTSVRAGVSIKRFHKLFWVQTGVFLVLVEESFCHCQWILVKSFKILWSDLSSNHTTVNYESKKN